MTNRSSLDDHDFEELLEDLRPNVERGARWLDENRPGWHLTVDVAALDLSEPDACICGQVFFQEAAEYKARELAEVEFAYSGFDFARRQFFDGSDPAVSLHGFEQSLTNASNGDAQYCALDVLWVEAIKARIG